MEVNTLRKLLQQTSADALTNKTYRKLRFSVCEGRTPDKIKEVEFWVLDHDFVYVEQDLFSEKQDMFRFNEAIEIQTIGHDYGLRLPRAHDWRGIGFWMTHDGKYYGVTKFNFEHAGHLWQNTSIPQTKDGGAYYWSGSSDKTGESARAAVFYPSGHFDVVFRPRTEGMKVRLVIDPTLLK